MRLTLDRIRKNDLMDNKNFSPKIKEVIERSREEALRLGHSFVTSEHLLLGIIAERTNLAVKVLESLDIDTTEL